MVLKLKILIVGLTLVGLATVVGAQKNAPLDEQKKCDAQASKVYHKGRELDGHHGEDPSGMNGYTSHFDAATNTCYVWVRWAKVDKQGISVADTISDAFEGRIYASYMWMNLEGKKFWEVKPTECWIKPRKQGKTLCEAEEEFDSLVDKELGIAR